MGFVYRALPVSAPAESIVAPLTAQLPQPSTSLVTKPAAFPDLDCPLRGHVVQVGEYLVGEAPDPRLSGHPGIRY